MPVSGRTRYAPRKITAIAHHGAPAIAPAKTAGSPANRPDRELRGDGVTGCALPAHSGPAAPCLTSRALADGERTGSGARARRTPAIAIRRAGGLSEQLDHTGSGGWIYTQGANVCFLDNENWRGFLGRADIHSCMKRVGWVNPVDAIYTLPVCFPRCPDSFWARRTCQPVCRSIAERRGTGVGVLSAGLNPGTPVPLASCSRQRPGGCKTAGRKRRQYRLQAHLWR